MILVQAKHLHAARREHGGFCTQGVDVWFKKHSLDLRFFLRHGYPIEAIEATGDLPGLQVARIARRENSE